MTPFDHSKPSLEPTVEHLRRSIMAECVSLMLAARCNDQELTRIVENARSLITGQLVEVSLVITLPDGKGAMSA